MRILNANEAAVVHGAGWSFLEWLWDTKKEVDEGREKMDQWLDLYHDYQDSVEKGNVSAEAACKALGDALKLVPYQETTMMDKAWAGKLVDAMCNHAAGTIIDGIKRYDQGIENEEQGNDPPPPGDDTAMNDYNQQYDWLDDALANWNESAVEDYWAGTGSYGSVEIEVCNA